MERGVASLPQARWKRIIPAAFVMYTIAFMDRLNVGMGLPYMEKDLHFGATAAGLASGILFIGYLFLQMPGGHWAERWSAKRFILYALIAWGACAMATGWVTNLTELLVVRFLLGVAEGGVLPATLVLLGHWFAREERVRARNLFYLCLPVASVVFAPLSGYILTVSNWHWMFVIEGVLPWIWAVIWAIAVEDWPRTAPWIAPAEREFIETALAAERADRELKTATHLGQALRTAQAWIFAIAYIGPNVASYGVSFFLPSLLKHAGYPIGVVGLLTALPFAMATVGILVHGFLADRSMHRRVHVIVPVAVLGVGLIISSLFQTVAPVVAILLLIAAGWGLYAYLGPFWTVVEQTFPAETAGPVMGFVNAIGNISGFFGPLVVGALVSSTHSYEPGFLFLGAWALIAVGLMSLIRIKEGAAARVTPGLTVSD